MDGDQVTVFQTMVQKLKNFEKMTEAGSYSDFPFPSPWNRSWKTLMWVLPRDLEEKNIFNPKKKGCQEES